MAAAAPPQQQVERKLELTLTAEDPALFEGEISLVVAVATLRQLCRAVVRSEFIGRSGFLLEALSRSSRSDPCWRAGAGMPRIILTRRRLRTIARAGLNRGKSGKLKVVLLHAGAVLSQRGGGLAALPARCALLVRRSDPTQRDRPAAVAVQPPGLAGEAIGALLPPWQALAAARPVPIATGGDGSAPPAAAARRRSVEFLLAGESVRANRHLARFAAAPYLRALLANPELDGSKTPLDPLT